MITSFSITQNNIVDDCNVMAVHSPLVFFVTCDYNGTSPEYLQVDVSTSLFGAVLKSYKAVPYDYPSGSTIRYRFDASAMLRSLMSDFADIDQFVDIWTIQPHVSKEFTLLFKDLNTGLNDFVSIIGIHSARQPGQTAATTDIVNNDDRTYIGYVGKPCYVYVWCEIDDLIQIGELQEGNTLDYDAEPFVDYDGEPFITQII